MKQTRKRYTLMIVALLTFDLFGVMSGTISTTYAAEGQPAQSEATPSGEKGGTCCKAGDTTPPTELVKQVPKGQLHSPYPDYAKLAKDDPDLVKEFRLPGCNECHGGTGGGGICPAVTQGVWFWGNTDDVLFRLVTLGSVDLEKEGYTRLTYGTVHAPMPPMGVQPSRPRTSFGRSSPSSVRLILPDQILRRRYCPRNEVGAAT